MHMKSRGAVYNLEKGDVREYECPHCHSEWLEWCQSTDYPEYCPHCGEMLISNEN